MDASMQSESPSTSRRRPRESETESQKIKREKAAERQRRKRERDRKNAGMAVVGSYYGVENQHLAAVALQEHQAALAAQQQLQQPAAQQIQPQQPQQQQPQSAQEYAGHELTPEEILRRDRVRAAARERQRKHRQLVKQRRMRELGIDMGNDIMPGMEEVHYRAAADGQYHQVLPPELQQQLQAPHPPIPHHEPPFPQGPPLGGQTFASTLLLSFSCAPLLKQHLLRTLGMSNEELASLEPIIAEAWDRWDHQRRMHYAEQVAKNGGQPPPMPPPYGVEMSHDPSAPPPPHPFPHPGGPPPPTDPNQAGNDFRARFHRSIIVPTPFRTTFTDAAQQQQQQQQQQPQPPASTATPSSSGSAPAEAIDPHLAATNGSNSTSTSTSTATKSETSASLFDELLTTGSP
ncbi:hypothetical protein JR316_0003954 [Psilocybe cubensis]|uniref:Uncharacterized protein n=2 Tax=Psilocybe cubensis TaxID=181762 RepID=A0A8H8CMG7_PSICU|nr:hypothetical protein JR316_0003954 [Psilocybe cubensis]KAH9484472.1 hypothetical protein JR316_0003954 [Psilocybe cubensis]